MAMDVGGENEWQIEERECVCERERTDKLSRIK